MHPIVYSEIKQVQRGYKVILFFIVLMVTARAALGDYGHLLNLFLLFPIIAGAIGTGVLSQEYLKDYLKFLFTLPVRRWHFILIKIIFSIIASGVFLLFIYIVKWTIPPRFTFPRIILPTFFNLKSLFVLAVIISLLNYAVCTFTITFLKSPKMAGSVNYLSVAIVFIYLLYRFLDSGYKYKQFDYVIILVPVSVTLIFGGFYLFNLRNPYLNRNPRHFITGIFIAMVCLFYFVGSTQLICYRATEDVFDINSEYSEVVSNDGIKTVQISPDGEFVFVQASLDRIVSHSFVLNSSGNVIANLGKNSSPLEYNMLWQFNNGKRILIYQKEKLILSELSEDIFTKFYALDLDNQREYQFKNIRRRGDSNYYKYRAFNCRTLEFYGNGYDRDSYREKDSFVFKYNIINGAIDTIAIPDSNGASIYDIKLVDFEHVVFKRTRKFSEDDKVQLNIFDLQKRELTKILAPRAYSGDYLINNGKCYFAETMLDETGYSYRIASGTAEEIEKIFVRPEELPRVSYRDAAERSGPDVSFNLSMSPHKKWIKCSYTNKDGESKLLLIDQEGKRIDAEVNSSVYFSPDETRFYTRIYNGRDKNIDEKDIIQIYDITGSGVDFVKDFEVDDNSYGYDFLNDKEMIYIKDPTPEEEWVNDRYLIKLDLETMESESFFE